MGTGRGQGTNHVSARSGFFGKIWKFEQKQIFNTVSKIKNQEHCPYDPSK
jgi:hypothetical protein